MKKLVPKKYIDLVNTKNPEVLQFCAKIKDGEIYEMGQVREHFGIGICAIKRWKRDDGEFKKYICYLRTTRSYILIFVSPKYKKELISTGKAIEKHPNG